MPLREAGGRRKTLAWPLTVLIAATRGDPLRLEPVSQTLDPVAVTSLMTAPSRLGGQGRARIIRPLLALSSSSPPGPPGALATIHRWLPSSATHWAQATGPRRTKGPVCGLTSSR
jgi:hypothetical protein